MTSVESSAVSWDGLGEAELEGRWGVPGVHLFTDVGSTNDEARRLASAGACAGTIVLADRQLAGRGRAGRVWDSPPGVGIWMSVIVAPPADAAAAGMLPLRVGVAVARAVERFVGPATLGLKWPNDLVVRGAKVAGVLCEGTWTGDRPGPVVVGVGLNVSQREDEIPPQLRGQATSLAAAAGRPLNRLAVADAVVAGLRSEVLDSTLTGRELEDELSVRDVLSGRRVSVTDSETAEPRVEGVAMGIGSDGALLVRVGGDSADGGDAGAAVEAVRAGTVRISEPSRDPRQEPLA